MAMMLPQLDRQRLLEAASTRERLQLGYVTYRDATLHTVTRRDAPVARWHAAISEADVTYVTYITYVPAVVGEADVTYVTYVTAVVVEAARDATRDVGYRCGRSARVPAGAATLCGHAVRVRMSLA